MMDGEQIDNDSIRHQLHNLQQRFDKISKENRNLIKFNDDLRAQIKLLTGKLQLHQKLDQATTSSKDSNTFDCLHCGHRSLSITKGWQDEATAKQMPIKDLVASAAQEVITSQDYVYDEKSRTYYIKSSGWYYYQDRKLFYDPKSQNYYTYDEKNKSYEFYANLNSTTVNNRTSKRKRLKLTEHQKLTASDIANDLSTDEDDGKDSANEDDGEDEEEKEDKKVEEEEEEGEVASSDDDMYGPEEAQPSKAICNPSEVSAGPTIYGQSIKLPCVRLIVQSSAALDEGSLVMVAYLGAQIGSQAKCDVEIDEESVDPLHARITYDEQEQAYWVRDLQSTHGSYVNDRLLDGTRCRLKHNDRLRFGQTSFLVHLHEQDLTCDDCEPGCVQAMLAKQRQQKSTDSSESVVSAPTPLLSKKQKMDVHRKELRKLQKKYGINTYAENATSFGASDFYSDRAESRRRVKGSDCPYEKNDLTATSTEKPISASNKGFQLLQKAGWKGQRSDLINDSRLIDVKVRDDRKGLGS